MNLQTCVTLIKLDINQVMAVFQAVKNVLYSSTLEDICAALNFHIPSSTDRLKTQIFPLPRRLASKQKLSLFCVQAH